MDLHIRPLNESSLADYLDFFDHRAFCDNPDWAGCYCIFNYFSGQDSAWLQQSGDENRALACAMIKSGALTGFLAFDGHIPVGWCSAGSKEAYARFSGLKTSEDENARICSVTCFVIASSYRRRGIAKALLHQACCHFAAQGYNIIEAYPRLDDGSCAMHYHGHPSMFLSEGFSVCKVFDDFACMQKML